MSNSPLQTTALSSLIVTAGLAALISAPTHAETKQPSSNPFEASHSDSEQGLEAQVPKPRPEDVSSPRAIVKALHDSVSGPQGAWSPDRLRSLCVPGVFFVYGEKGKDGVLNISTLSLNNAVTGFTRLHEQSDWYERVNRMNVTQVEKKGGYLVATVTYSVTEGTKRVTRTQPDAPLGSSTELMHIGNRWWVVSHMW
jgi:hypothetical protein